MHLVRRNPFLRACAIGDMREVERLLAKGEDIDQVDCHGASAVHIAVLNRDLPMLCLLAGCGADMSQPAHRPDGEICLPVESAIKTGFLEGLRFLVDECGARLESAMMHPQDMLLFHALEQPGNILTLRYLIEEKNLDPRYAVVPDNDYTLLHAAELRTAPPAIVEYLLRQGVPPNVDCRTLSNTRADDSPYALYDGLPLTMAAFKGEPGRVALYLRYGADPELRNKYSKTALDAVRDKYGTAHKERPKDFAAVDTLIETALAGGPPPPDKANDFTLACELGRLGEIRERLNDDANPNQMNAEGYAGIHIAIMTHNLPLLKMLMTYGADPYLHVNEDETNITPIELAIEEGFLPGLRYLHDKCDVPLESRPGSPVEELLFLALVKKNNILTLRYLVEEKGLDPARAIAPDGLDLLTDSENANSYLTYTEYLLMLGMDPDAEAPERIYHRRPGDFDLFERNPREEACQSLPLVRAAFNAEAELSQLYLDYGADPLAWNRHNNSPSDAVNDRTNPHREKDKEDCDKVRRVLYDGTCRFYDSPHP